MTVLAVALGTAFVCATLVLTATVSADVTRAYRAGPGGPDVVVRSDDTAGPPSRGEPALPRGTLERLRRLPEAAAVTGVATGYTAIGCPDGRPAGDGAASVGTGWTRLGPAPAAPRYTFTAGGSPSRPGEIAVDAATAARCGYRVGDTARISLTGPGLRARITGVLTTTDPATAAGGTLVVFDPATAQRRFAAPGRWTEIDVEAAHGVSARRLLDAATAVLPPHAVAVTGASLAADRALSARSSVDALCTTLLSFAAVALFVCCFLIANTFTMLVAQRTRETGLLRAVGASRRQVTARVLTEALVVGAAASLAGVAAGIALAAALRPYAGALDKGAALPSGGPLSVPWYTLAVPLLAGVATTLAASWLPARRAARIAPLAALRATHAPAPGRTTLVRGVVGALLTTSGVAAVLGGAAMRRVQDGAPVLTLGAVAATTGAVALLPLLLRPVHAVAAPALRATGTAGALAARTSARDVRRVCAAAAPLVIGVTLVAALTMVAAGSQAAADEQGAHVLTADYQVTMDDLGPLSDGVERTLAATPGVTATASVREASATVDGTDEYVTALPARAVPALLRPRFTAGGPRGFGGTGVLVSDDQATANGWTVGTRLPARLPDGTRVRLTVVGVYRSDDLLTGVLLDSAELAGHGTAVTKRVLVTTDRPAGPAVRAALSRALGDSPALRVDSSDDLSRASADATRRMLGLPYGLLGVSVAVAFLGIANTLALSVTERRREIGMLRAIGMDRAGVRAMVRWEAVFITFFGGAVGMALGVFVGWAAGRLLGGGLVGYSYALPVPRLLTVVAAAALAGVAASLWPAHRAARTEVLAAVGAE
ncbi:putative ABC transporter permease protein [Streptantibioticus cattleyicolor NRRL 8057 = DSM 46488]|nr:putative ABC transporter permease protein [Streptantibioticus cattleyicolor NRRL 8057 = DSM 46488]